MWNVNGKTWYSKEEYDKLQTENEAYKQSEHEATEIIAELEHKIKKCNQVFSEIMSYLEILSVVDSDFVNTETYLRIKETILNVHSKSK